MTDDVYLKIFFGAQPACLPASAVGEVLAPQPLTALPDAKDFIAGIVNLRGDIVCAVDAAPFFGATKEAAGRHHVIIRKGRGILCSLLADAADGVHRLPLHEILPPADTLPERWRRAASGMWQGEEGIVPILSTAWIEKLFEGKDKSDENMPDR